MRETIKNKIRLAIMVPCMALLMGSSMAAAEDTVLLASLTRVTPLEDLESYDRFPGYHREAREVESKKEIKVEVDMIDELKKADKNDNQDAFTLCGRRVKKRVVDIAEVGHQVAGGPDHDVRQDDPP